MRLLMLSSDENIFDAASPVARRMALYGSLVDELSIVVVGSGAEKQKDIASNVRAVFPGGSNKLSAFLNARKTLHRVTGAARYDLVSAQDPFFIGLLGYGIAKARRIPLQVQLHTDCFSPGFFMESPRRALEALVALFVLNQARCIRVVSERIARSVRPVTRVPLTVLPIYVRRPEEKLERKAGDHTGTLKLLSVGRLTKEKRVHIIIEAVAKTSGVELTVVGDGPLRESLEFRVQSLGLGERVRFVGWQDPTDYYQDADVFVQASRYEGYGATLMEAALHGLPIITTDVGVVGETLKHEESALVVEGNSNAIARAAGRLIGEPALRERLGALARESALQGTLASEEEYLMRYQEALKRCTK